SPLGSAARAGRGAAPPVRRGAQGPFRGWAGGGPIRGSSGGAPSSPLRGPSPAASSAAARAIASRAGRPGSAWPHGFLDPPPWLSSTTRYPNVDRYPITSKVMLARSRWPRLADAHELQHREDQHDGGDQGHEAGADRAEGADLDDGDAADDPAKVQDDRRPRLGVWDRAPSGRPEETGGVQHETAAHRGDECRRRDTQNPRERAGSHQERDSPENRRDSVDDERRAKQHDRT